MRPMAPLFLLSGERNGARQLVFLREKTPNSLVELPTGAPLALRHSAPSKATVPKVLWGAIPFYLIP